MAIVTRTARPKSVRNRCVIEVFGGVFVLSLCILDFSVGVGAFMLGLCQIFSFALENNGPVIFIIRMTTRQQPRRDVLPI